MGKRKIINDAVHGFISIPNDFLYELLQHRFMQRLNRIKQLGVSAMVYPSATHTRFQHSLGAMHLTSEAVKELRLKGHNISDDEEKAVMAAILLHDIGHCPYSHVLENIIVGNIRHERIRMEALALIRHLTGMADSMRLSYLLWLFLLYLAYLGLCLFPSS